MGTNYYVTINKCPHCGRGEEELHIGKSSSGWCFSLRTDGEIKSLEDWMKIWKENPFIHDEYKRDISVPEMIGIITNRQGRRDGFNKVPFGYDSWDDFFRKNHAQVGPNNLVRHKLGDDHCVGHGFGTYDLITGEFS